MKKISYKIMCILLAVCAGKARAQVSGVVTVPGTYTSIAAAISDLNTNGVSGAVTVNIAAGYTETAPVGGFILNTITGVSATAPLIFQKSGPGTNPLITAYTGTATPASAVQDGVWNFVGTDYVTIDGIDITDPNTTNPATMEYGYGFFKANAANGCQNNTIKNCVITLSRNNNASGTQPTIEGSKAISLINASVTNQVSAITVTLASGSNSFNKFYSNTLQNCNIGVNFYGYADSSPYALADIGNDVGGTSAATGNTIINYGGAASAGNPASGVCQFNEYSLNISYNVINNNNGSGVNHPNTIRGIFMTNGNNASATIIGNTVTINGGGTSQGVTGIENAAGTSGTTNTIVISNNLITNCTYATATSGTFYGIVNSTSPSTLVVTNNTLTNNSTNATSGTYYNISNSGSVVNLCNISNNLISGTTFSAASTSLTYYSINNSSIGSSAVETINNNSIQNITYAGATGGTGSYRCISSSSSPSSGTLSIQNNTFNNLNLKTTGTIYLMYPYGYSNLTSITGNSVVGTFSRTGTSGTFAGIYNDYSTTSGTTANINNNNISNISNGASTSSIYGIYWTTHANCNIYNNAISNIAATSGVGSFYGIYSYYYSTVINIYNNTISNFSYGNGTMYGLYYYQYYATLGNIYNNTISNLQMVGATLYGMYMAYTGGYVSNAVHNIYKNRITDLGSANTSATAQFVSGMYFNPTYAGTVNAYNNLIGNLTATLSNNPNSIQGINLASSVSGYSLNLAFNSIFISGTSTGTAFGATGIYATTGSSNLTMLNNLVVNTATAVGSGVNAAFRATGTSNSFYTAASNNNLFYAGVPSATNLIYYDGTTGYQTLAAYKALMVNRDQSAVTENAPFVTTTGAASNFLGISTSIPTQVESGGTPVAGITDDFGGTIRSTTLPDIGAWEGNYILSDLLPPNITGVTYSLTSGCNLTSAVVTVTMTDAGGVATGTAAPRAYFKVGAGAYTSVAGTLASGTANSGVWTFNLTFAGSTGNVLAYYVVSQDVAGNLSASPSAGFVGTNVNTITTPPTSPNTYVLGGTMNGVYNVGAGQVFTTLTNAALAYNVACLTGPVTFSLTDATYTTEAFPITFLNNVTANATNSLLIKPAAGVNAIITGTSASAMIFINGGDYIKIDGSNNGTNSQNLTVENTNAVSSAAVIWIGNASLTDAASNITINNSIITGSTGVTSVGGVILGSGMTLGSPSDISNNNMTFTGNTFLKTQNGVFAYGNATTFDANWKFINNTFGSSTAASKLGYRGIAVQNAQQFTIMSNTIAGISNTGNTAVAILAGAGLGSGTISLNVIRDIKTTATSGAYGIQLNSSSAAAGVLVVNNFISDLASNGSSTLGNNSLGIYITNGGGFKVYHNTVYMNGVQVSTSGVPSAFAVASGVTAVGGIDVRNNIFANAETVGANKYAIYSAAAANVFAFVDYNAYSTSGSNLGFIGSARAALSNIQAGFGSNINSSTVVPVFTSTVDLHLVPASNAGLDNTGIALGITTDIDAQNRNLITPDMGADEFDGPACSGAIGGTISTASYTRCTSAQNITLTTSGASNGTGITYQWQVSPVSGGTFTNVAVGTGTGLASYFTGGNLVPGTYYFKVIATCSVGPVSAASNEATVVINQTPTASLVVPSGTLACVGQNININGSSDIGTTYSLSGPNGYSSSSANTLLSAISLTNSGTYSLTISTPLCAANTLTAFISVKAYYSPFTASASTNSVCAGVTTTLSASGATIAGTATLGTLQNQNSSTGYPAPYSVYYGGQRMQMLILASELSAGGFSAGSALTSVQFPVVSLGTNWPGTTSSLQNFQVSLGSTSLTALSSFQSGLTIVAPAATFTPAVGYNNTHNFTTSFIWDGVSNIILETAFSNNISGTSSDAVIQYYTNTSFVSSILYRADSSPFSTISAGTTVNNSYSGRPDMKLNGSFIGIPSWTPSLSVLPVTGQTVVATPSVSTNYTATVSNGGCTTNTTVLVNVLTPTLSISGASGLCFGQTATLTASGANTYTWANTGVTTTTLVDTPAGTTTYTLVGKNTFGCTTQTTQIVNVATSLNIGITGVNGACSNSVVGLTATGGVTYTWSTGATTSTIAPTFTGTTTYSVVGASGTCTNSAVKTISLNPNPVIAVTGNSVICAGQSTSLAASGASTYAWSGSNINSGAATATAFISPTSNAVYTVVGTSSAGCNTSFTTAVTSNSLPVITVVASPTGVCLGLSSTLTASGANSSYSWTSGPATTTLGVTTATANPVFVVTGSNTSGCSATKSFTLPTFSIPTVAIAPASSTICSTSTLNLTASGAGTGGTYSWTSGPATNTYVVSPANATTYTAVGTTSNGCVSSMTAVVVTNTLPALAVVPVTATVCSQSPVSYTASGGVSYAWSNNGGTSPSNTYFPQNSSVYTVTATNAQGCIKTATMAVTTLSLPVIQVSPAISTVCANSATSFTATGAASYTWNNNSSITGSVASLSTATLTSYNVAGTDVNGCNSNGSFIVFANPQPNLSIAASNSAVCAFSPVSFTASGANNYVWTNGPGTAVFSTSPSVNTTYTVTGTETVHNCSNTATVSVIANALPTVAITPASPTVCAKSTLTLTGSGAVTYVWSNTSGNVSINLTPNTSTVMTLTGIDAIGCSKTQTVTVTVNPLPTISAPSNLNMCVGEINTFTVGGANTYTLMPDNKVGTGSFSVSPQLSSVYIYTITGTDNNNCVNKITVNLIVDECVGIKTNSFSGNQVSVYPNPSSGRFTTSFDFAGEKTIQISDMTGKVINAVTSSNHSEEFDLSQMAKGVYFVKISTKDASANFKIVID